MKTKNLITILLFAILIAALLGCQAAPEEIVNPVPATEEAGQRVDVGATLPPTVTPAEVAIPVPFEPIFEPGTCPFEAPADLGPEQSVECGFVVVPADHFNPGPETLRIAVVVMRDHRAEHRPDPLIVLAGGPGEKVVENAPLLANLLGPLYENRDLVIYDQRGIGRSEPALECPEWQAGQLDLLAEADLKVIAEKSFDSWMRCRDRLVEEGHNLSLYNTRQNAADVNALRLALGYETINLFGGSYGSLLAQATMRDYPAGIRSVMIDSVLPLEKSLFVDVSVTAPEAILRLVRACEADPNCSEAYPNLEQVLYEVIDRLDAEPVPITLTNPLTGESYDGLLTGFTVRSNLIVFLYETTIIPILPKAIYDVYEGDYSLMTQLRSLYLAKLGALSRGVLFSVMCSEDLIGREPDEYITLQESLPRQLVGDRYPEEVDKYGVFAICQNWPVEEAEAWVKEPVQSEIPALVLSGEFDPVTPAGYGKLVAKNLPNSTHFEFPGVGHSVLVSDDCAREMAAAFLADPEAAVDPSCMAGRGVVFATGQGLVDLVFEPVAIEDFGIEAVVPQGWLRAAPEYWVSPDRTIELVLKQKYEEPLESFVARWGGSEVAEQLTLNGLVWSLYAVGGEGSKEPYGGYIAAAPSEAGYFVVLALGPAEQSEPLLEHLIRPILTTFVSVPIPKDTEQSGSAESVSDGVTLVSFENSEFGIQGLVPETWSEAAPGVNARSAFAGDQTLLIQKSYPGMTLDELLDMLLPALGIVALPESTGQLATPDFSWDMYQVAVEAPGAGTVRIALALAETSDKPYLVLLQVPEADFDEFFEAVYLPAVNALAPLP